MEAVPNPTSPPAAPAPRQAFESMKLQRFKDCADVNNKVLLDIDGRGFCISLRTVENPRQYIIFVNDIEVLHVPKAKSIATNTTVDRVAKYIARKMCNEEEKAVKSCLAEVVEQIRGRVREALTALYKRVTIRKPEVPTGEKVVYVRPPYFHIEDANIACALSFELAVGEKGIKYTPYLVCVDKDKNIATYRLIDAAQTGIKFGDVMAFLSSVALEKIVTQAETIDELEDMLSRWMKGGVALTAISGVPTIPTRAKLEKYLHIVKRDPEGWAKSVARFVRDSIFKLSWRLLPVSQKAVMVGTVLAASVFPVLPYTTKVVFHSAGPGAGKSYHIGITASFIPYNLVISTGTGAGIERSVDFAVAVSVDDIPQREDARRELADLLIRGFKRDSKRVLTAPDGTSPMAIGGGPIVFIPDLAYQLLGLSDAATSRAVSIAVATDHRFVEIKAPEEVVVKEVIRDAKLVNPDTGEVLILPSAEDWYALFTAVGLMMWHRFIEELERLRAELKEKPKVVGRYAQAYGAIIAALRTYGQNDLADRVMASLMSRERRDEALEMLTTSLFGLWNEMDRLPEEIYVRRESLIDGSLVIFSPLGSVVRYAASRLVTTYGDVPQVTDRVRLEESANASFKTIEQWMRRAIPKELQNDKNLLAYIQGHPALRLLLFKVNNRYGHPTWALVITERVVKSLALLVNAGDIETAVVVFCTVRRRICDEVDLPQREQMCRLDECEDMLQQPRMQQPTSADLQQQNVDVQMHTQRPEPEQQLGDDMQQQSPQQGLDTQHQSKLESATEDADVQRQTPRRNSVEKKSKEEILKEFEEFAKKYGEF
jgi:hypothetical protein